MGRERGMVGGGGGEVSREEWQRERSEASLK